MSLTSEGKLPYPILARSVRVRRFAVSRRNLELPFIGSNDEHLARLL